VHDFQLVGEQLRWSDLLQLRDQVSSCGDHGCVRLGQRLLTAEHDEVFAADRQPIWPIGCHDGSS
jgi:hypothetical protein